MAKFVLKKGDKPWNEAIRTLDMIEGSPDGGMFQGPSGYTNGRLNIMTDFVQPTVKGGQHLRRAVMSLPNVRMIEIHELRNGLNARIWHSVILFTHDSIGEGDLVLACARMREEIKASLSHMTEMRKMAEEGEASMVSGFMNNILIENEPDPKNMREVNPRPRKMTETGLTIDLEPEAPAPLLRHD